LSQIKFNDVAVKDEMSKINQQVIEKIQQLVPKAEINSDFEILGTTDNSNQTIEVKAKPFSKRLTGTFNIFVDKFDLSTMVIDDLDVLSNDAEISNRIVSKIKNINNEYRVIENTDFKVAKINDNKVNVEALDKSEFLKGDFKIELNKIDLGNLSQGLFDNLNIGSGINEVIQEVEKAINKMLIRVGELEPRKTVTKEEFIVRREEELEGH
jgi:hypothetical protein